jgi:hypothetical protein
MVLRKQFFAVCRAPGMLHWLRKGAVLAILGLATVVVPAITIAPQLLFKFYEILLPNGSAISNEWRTARGGEAVLPQKVRAMIAVLRENEVTEFRHSEAIVHDPDSSVTQRLAEGAYPIRLSGVARHWLLSANEPLGSGCVALDSREGIVLARCP